MKYKRFQFFMLAIGLGWSMKYKNFEISVFGWLWKNVQISVSWQEYKKSLRFLFLCGYKKLFETFLLAVPYHSIFHYSSELHCYNTSRQTLFQTSSCYLPKWLYAQHIVLYSLWVGGPGCNYNKMQQNSTFIFLLWWTFGSQIGRF